METATVGAAETNGVKTRLGRKPRTRRVRISLPPKLPVPVRALWETAEAAEREQAHRTATLLLEVWLGRRSREEAAKALGIPPLRLWHLSQQATCGMVAGLVKQPAATKQVLKQLREGPQETLAGLHKRIAELERETVVQRELIGLLRGLPGKTTKQPGRTPARKKNRGAPMGRRPGKLAAADSTAPAT